MLSDEDLSFNEVVEKFNFKVHLYIAMFIFINIWKSKTYQAEHLEIFLIFYKKKLEHQEHKAILNILSEAIITVKAGSLTYFNR